MQEPESGEQLLTNPSANGNGAAVVALSTRPPSPPDVGPAQAGPGPGPGPVAPGPMQPAPVPCPTCGTGGSAMPPSYVYALGRIEPRFPRISVEKEFAQATGRAETANLTDRQALQRVLQKNRYLVRQMCWVMTVAGLETYIVAPRDPADSQLLVETLRPNPRPGDVDLVVGIPRRAAQ